ncbi:class I SAM-dependent methyltransferase [Paucibacter sp. B2R-40]|uniref:class I SAM-dependent methyltransferase n=1 Tax=Paucibacter sp. B2R-40 TaxID=2893554 RepID=UPI0021E440F9|nr:class I SAM-dependent methyltransferase [Paucibacter sp. B2R-40]MCV2355265.1 class I SAM-dependent methyltransferase [Paucibacter sp. B2R-40]
MDHSDQSSSTAQAFGSFAQSYAEKYFGLPDYHAHLDRFLNGLKLEQTALLDLACGPGNVSAYLLARRPSLRIHGLDLAPEMIEIARRKIQDAVSEVGDCRDLALLNRQGLRYDAAVFSFGLSYLNDGDADQCLKGLYAQLRPSASLYLTSLTGDPAQSGSIEVNGHSLYTAYRSADDILARITAAGFQVSFSALISSPANATVQTQDLVAIATRGEDEVQTGR